MTLNLGKSAKEVIQERD